MHSKRDIYLKKIPVKKIPVKKIVFRYIPHFSQGNEYALYDLPIIGKASYSD